MSELITDSGGWDIARLEQFCTVEESWKLFCVYLSLMLIAVIVCDGIIIEMAILCEECILGGYYHRSNVDSVVAERWKGER